jgi:hypothetical protein
MFNTMLQYFDIESIINATENIKLKNPTKEIDDIYYYK